MSIQIVVAAGDCDVKVAALNAGLGIFPSCIDAAGGFSYAAPFCTATTACTLGATFQTVPPTATTDRVCGGRCSACPTGQQTAQLCTLARNTVCSSTTTGGGSKKLSPGADVGIAIAVLVVLAGAGVGFVYYTKAQTQATTFKQKDALHERLLDETRGDLEESQALNSRMRAACTSLSGSISTILTVLSWICVGIHMCGALPSPVCA